MKYRGWSPFDWIANALALVALGVAFYGMCLAT